MGTPIKNVVVAVCNNETTPPGADSILDEFTKASYCRISDTNIVITRTTSVG